MIKLNIQPFTLPVVVSLMVQSQGEPFKMEVAPNYFLAMRNIYYELRDINGVMRESGTQTIPEHIYVLCGEFVMGNVSQQTLSTINGFFQYAGWSNIVTINPTPTPSVTPSSSLTPTPSITPSVTLTPSETPTPSITPSVTLTPSETPII